jgi:hypothetical protein
MAVSPFATAPRPHVELWHRDPSDPARDETVDLRHAPLKDVNTLPLQNGLIRKDELRKGSVVKGSELTAKGSVRKTLPKISDDAAAARALGVQLGEWAWFACPMPGHDGVATFEDEDGELRLSCDCFGLQLRDKAGRADHHYALSDAFYSVTSGKVLDRTNNRVPGRFVWRLLLLAESGVVVPHPIDAAALPDDAHPDLHRGRQLVVMLAGVRITLAQEIGNDPLPMPLGEALVKDYCRVSNPRAVIGGLISAGVLRQVGRAPLSRGQVRSAFLYEPVSQPDRSVSNDRGTRPCLSQPSSH